MARHFAQEKAPLQQPAMGPWFTERQLARVMFRPLSRFSAWFSW
ncbi:hypothetical protein DNK06_08680 [Pseudomonas daroniae]|uniref:Uncharacterized protein n=1 Tax=Phytopseudomonas daroniae TaxID=2487519 RepID=A0A4Q9QQG6_9GAMM|nr:hypothetical protein DNK06_08680 [Pseudomonas daroniae]TBU83702.1 hypothetical protein DNK31_09445 [Pseudomonas sp. FRB 228]TBU89365.1 hypothetical protein DNJ99_16675 [Pseudomonas daroniae]